MATLLIVWLAWITACVLMEAFGGGVGGAEYRHEDDD